MMRGLVSFWRNRSGPGKATLVLGAVLVAAVAAAGGIYLHWANLGGRYVTVAPGKVYQSAALPQQRLLRHVESEGLRAVIDLRDDHREQVAAEGEALARIGVKHFHLPTNIPPSDATVAEFLAIVQDPANQPLLIHCEHGEGRSVLFAGLYRVAMEGKSNEAAWRETVRLPDELAFLRHLVPMLGRLRDEKAEYLLNFGRKPN